MDFPGSHNWTLVTLGGITNGLFEGLQWDFLDNCNWTFCLPKMAHPGGARNGVCLGNCKLFCTTGARRLYHFGDPQMDFLGNHNWILGGITIGLLGESQLDFLDNCKWIFGSRESTFGAPDGPEGATPPPRHHRVGAPLRLGCAQAVPECFPEISSWHVVLRIRAQTIIRNPGTGLPGIAGCKYRPRQCSTRERQERTRNRATARRTLRQSVARHCQTRNDTSCTTAHTASHQLQKARQHTPNHQTSHATNYTTNYTKQEAGARPNPAGGRQCHQLQNRKRLRRAPEESRRPPPIQENGLRTSRDGALPI
jgi:hypothetical protein